MWVVKAMLNVTNLFWIGGEEATYDDQKNRLSLAAISATTRPSLLSPGSYVAPSQQRRTSLKQLKQS